MISIWWVVFAFIGGGWVGILLLALMHVADSGPGLIECRPIQRDRI